jgi:hypothetical protein
MRFVLPARQHVADAALNECRRRAARAGVEHGNMGVEIRDEGLRLVQLPPGFFSA